MSLENKVQRSLKERVRRDLRTLRAYWPSEYFSISQLINEELPLIPLSCGDLHEVDKEQLRKIKEHIPEHLWDLVKLPFTFRYEKDRDGRSWYVVLGDRWQKRAVELLVHGKLSSEGVERIDVEDFKKLIRDFSTLIFVSISTSFS